MRMLIHVKFPIEPFNTAVRDGSAGKKIERILAETKPEAVYFTEYDGRRGAIMIVDVADASKIPALAEPWFLLFHAELSAHVVMTPDDLAKSGLEALGKKVGMKKRVMDSSPSPGDCRAAIHGGSRHSDLAGAS